MTETKTKTVTHDSLVKALVAFQSEMPTVGKDKINPHFKSRYADISSITEDVMPVLAKHGLAFSCQPRSADNGYEIFGVLMHDSGDTISGSLPLFGNDAQKIGSSITYARRYLLCALTGVVTGDEDDDGNMATTTNERVQRQAVSRAASTPTKNLDEVLVEMLATTTRKQALALWAKYSLDGAPATFQDQVKQHAITLPEE
jgi:hypothetical protein